MVVPKIIQVQFSYGWFQNLFRKEIRKKCISNFGNPTKKYDFYGKKVWNRSNANWLFLEFIPTNYEKFDFWEFELRFFFQVLGQRETFFLKNSIFFISTPFWKKLLQGTKFETNHM